MSKKYNVLWIDDQHESLTAVHKTATDFNIQLWPYKSMNGGCQELNVNLPKYDAVLLDAKFFENEDDKPGSEDTQWIYDTKDRIRDLDKSLKYFVLTGQAKTYASEEFNKAFKNVFEKGKDEDEDVLFKMLVEACQNRELTRLKHKYPNQFEMCSNEYIGEKHFDRVLGLINDIEKIEDISIAQDMLNPMRKILEALFEKLNTLGVIPDGIMQGKGAINGSSMFLSGIHTGYDYDQEIIHPIISESIFRLLNLTQDASHNTGSKLKADEYFASSKSHHLYVSSIYLLLDILDWMKDFIDNNSDKTKNLTKWFVKPIEQGAVVHQGIIQQDQDNNYYCDKYYLNYNYVNENSFLGKTINITQESINSNLRTKHLYSHYAAKFETIN